MDGGYYHIVTRGIDRRRLFRNQQDYKFFFETIARYLKEFQIDIFHYCLMPNHLHLLIRVNRREDLAKFMQGILQVYAHYFRKKYSSVGFVFQNRYKSRHIDNDAYLLDCGRYIERNPLRAGLATDLYCYPWSSFLFYARGESSGIIKVPNPLYACLGATHPERQAKYAERVLEIRLYEHIIDKEFKIR